MTSPAETTPPADDDGGTFAALGLRPELLSVLTGLGYEEPTPIQREAVPPLIEGRDLQGQAATGTGKTAAYALPVLQRLPAGRTERDPAALVLVPTRELAIQVAEAFYRYGRGLGTRVVPVYGGQPIGRQLRALDGGVDVVVATPGRALDHLQRSTLRLGGLTTVVLDEADEMLDMGFAEDLEAILDETPAERQTVMFSATMPRRLDALARRYLRDPVRLAIARERPASGEGPLVRQTAYVVPRASKPAALGRVLDLEAPTAAIVFCRTREEVNSLSETLNARGYRAEALHGGLSQEQRDRVMGRLRAGTAELLVATDVAARGLDIDQLTHVVNYDVPAAAETYVHRIGRVGRAGREGTAITLVEPRGHRMLKTIEHVTGSRISVEKLPTVADLRARRLELTRAALRESLLEDELDRFRAVVDALTDEFDVVDVALAAVKLAHEASAPAGDDEDIPDVPLRSGPDRSDRDRGGSPRSGADPRGRGAGGRPRSGAGMARLFIGLGRSAGVRPGDLVGAITGEAGLNGRDVGGIEISERFSLVEVPETSAADVIAALRQATIKGRRPTVKRDQAGGSDAPAQGRPDRGDDRPPRD
ncbi:DEAD/DEAH box helicase [Kineococcus rubinsiae]|uniref:DEAD/DEAH box helicase n=1 Tax=Kineococcus rubinsiae TaxID=2609562 RepID=UPI001430FE9C|nr:DEAD/DEAH box helicase [Kineococcus rubinsiae]NIZ92270.1 DEAD/DEAH box helicase [Kineococcus rubinsiae]